MAGKTRITRKTRKLGGKSIVRGGAGTASRTIGLLGGIMIYAVEAGIIETNPIHGIKKPKDNIRQRRLSEAEYRTLGRMLADAECLDTFQTFAMVVRQIAMTGCRSSEIIGLKWAEVDLESGCLRLSDSKEGASIRPIGLPVGEFFEARSRAVNGEFVFPGERGGSFFGALTNQWDRTFKGTVLGGVTPHVLRHSFASVWSVWVQP